MGRFVFLRKHRQAASGKQRLIEKMTLDYKKFVAVVVS